MTKKVASMETVVETAQVVDAVHAPFVYFDVCTNFGTRNGVVMLTICAQRILPGVGDKVAMDFVAVANLRCSAEAAVGLKDSIEKALLMLAPTEGQSN